jgi:hypothetical protein
LYIPLAGGIFMLKQRKNNASKNTHSIPRPSQAKKSINQDISNEAHLKGILQKASTNAKLLTHSDFMHLQQTMGNRAVTQLLKNMNAMKDTQGNIQKNEDAALEVQTVENKDDKAGVIQGYFTVATKEFTSAEDVTEFKENILDNIPKSMTNSVSKAALIKKIKGFAEADALVQPNKKSTRFKSYEELIKFAIASIQKEKADLLPKVDPTTIKFGKSTKYDPTLLKGTQKVNKLKRFRRSASIESSVKDDIKKFRDTTKIAKLKHKKRGYEYSIGHTGNFLLGEITEHTYKELISNFKTTSGLDDKQTATRLTLALTGEGDAYNGLKESACKFFVKLVALINGPEFRRAAINPVSAIAALNVVATNGGDLFDILNEQALFAKTDGGSENSQYHRKKVKEDDIDFIKTSSFEFDNIMKLAEVNGIDITKEDEVEKFVRQGTQSTMLGLKKEFKF